ncbi:nucleotidyltransferase family protein [Candidatus Omnitrophota bacterium]
MKAIILAAGYGTRLYPLTKDIAKPLLPIRGKPIVEYIVNKVQHISDVDEIIVVCNDKFHKQFQKWVDNCASMVPITLVNDGSRNEHDKLGAISDLAYVYGTRKIDDDVIVLGGDNIFDFCLSEFIEFARSTRGGNTVGIYDMDGKYKPGKFGVVKLADNRRVIDFIEKPQGTNGSKRHLVSMCLYYFPKEKISMIDEYARLGHDLDKIGSFIQWLAKEDNVFGHVFDGTWLDIGDIDAYAEAVYTF